MKFKFKSKSIRLTSGLQRYTEKKIRRLSHFCSIPIDAVSINLNVSAYARDSERQIVKAVITVQNKKFIAQAATSNVYYSINAVYHELKNQFLKSVPKRKIREVPAHKQWLLAA